MGASIGTPSVNWCWTEPCFPVVRSKSVTAPSIAPEATRVPSGEYVTLMANLPCEFNLATFSPLSTSNTVSSPVLLPATRFLPSVGDNAILYALTGPASMSCNERRVERK